MLNPDRMRAFWQAELESDRAWDDVTASLLADRSGRPAQGVVIAKESGIFCGARALQHLHFPGIELERRVEDGMEFRAGTELVAIRGSAAACLSLERTLLNLLSHLCGVATLTRRFVKAVQPHPAKILATRKTLPGMRELQLYAVCTGGGHVHRRSLCDGILIKENHLMFMDESSILKAAEKNRSPVHGIEIEVQSLEVLDRVLVHPPDVVMLDNFSIDQAREAVQRIRGRCRIEASGGMALETVGQFAALGVDYISVGRLTHSAPSIDLSMDFRETP